MPEYKLELQARDLLFRLQLQYEGALQFNKPYAHEYAEQHRNLKKNLERLEKWLATLPEKNAI